MNRQRNRKRPQGPNQRKVRSKRRSSALKMTFLPEPLLEFGYAQKLGRSQWVDTTPLKGKFLRETCPESMSAVIKM